MRILTTIRCGALQKQSLDVSRPHLRARQQPQFGHCGAAMFAGQQKSFIYEE